ncbi:MAG: tetratricopeptide repeat-containing protein [Deltaproteobacteria bacterium]|nr:tetratricopeptide repeat-containing protein [Deltaproteobacteria bacterium]
MKEFEKVIYLNPSSVSACLELAAIHENEGDFVKARRMREAALGVMESLPKDETVTPYEGTTAAELASHVRNMLD